MRLLSRIMRRVIRRPAIAMAGALTLAIGIGAVVAGFSALKGVVLEPLPYPEADRLVFLFREQPPVRRGPISREVFLGMQRDVPDGVSLSGYAWDSFTLLDEHGAERVLAAETAKGFFKVLQLPPVLGRHLADADQRPDAEAVAVISHRLWQQRYAGAQDVIGETVRLNGQAHTIVGVANPALDVPVGADIWRPARFETSGGEGNYIHLFARLASAAALPALVEWSNRHAGHWEASNPTEYRDLHFNAFEFADWRTRRVRDNLWLVFGAVGLVLLIACANVANLLLTRTLTRSREIATHAALGAPRRSLAFDALAESLLIATAGLAGGIVLAWLGVRFLREQAAGFLPRADNLEIDSDVALFAIGITLLTALLCGVLPALFARRANIAELLRSGSKESTGSTSQAWRKSLVIGEMAMCTALVVGALLLVTTLQRLAAVDPGFDTTNLLSAQVVLAPDPDLETWEPYAAEQASFVRRVGERLSALPGVVSVGVVDRLPTSGGHWSGNVQLAGETYPDGRGPTAEFRFVDADYFDTLGLSVIDGRGFDEAESGPPRAVVNRAFAEQIGGGEEMAGRTVEVLGMTVEIIGVTSNIRQWGLDSEAYPEIHFLYGQTPAPVETTLVVKTAVEPLSLERQVREAVRQANPDVPVFNVKSMEQIVAGSYAQRTFVMELLLAFGIAALLIAAVGLYAVLSYTISQRTREIGVQLALGATSMRVLASVFREGLTLALTGVGVGCGIALFAARLMGSLVHGVSFHEPVVYGAAALVLGLTALAACCIPAWRASRVKPMEALRYE